jgi:hypothetical protein
MYNYHSIHIIIIAATAAAAATTTTIIIINGTRGIYKKKGLSAETIVQSKINFSHLTLFFAMIKSQQPLVNRQ